jgi:hypothetical protein
MVTLQWFHAGKANKVYVLSYSYFSEIKIENLKDGKYMVSSQLTIELAVHEILHRD